MVLSDGHKKRLWIFQGCSIFTTLLCALLRVHAQFVIVSMYFWHNVWALYSSRHRIFEIQKIGLSKREQKSPADISPLDQFN